MITAAGSWNMTEADALAILSGPASHDKSQISAALHVLDQDTIFTEIKPPKVHVTLPKQKALQRITREILLRSPFVFKPTVSRVDGTIAINSQSGEIVQIYPQHTRDACADIDMFDGIMTYEHQKGKIPIPHIALVGLDGLHNQRLLEDINTISVTRTFQTTTAEFVAAARTQEQLERLGEQKVIIVAKSYAEIYKDWHQKCFPESNTSFREVEGGSEGRVSITPGAEVVVDITDSGQSLKENGLEFVTRVSSASPALCRHIDLRETFDQAIADYVDTFGNILTEASARAFPNSSQFEPNEIKAEYIETQAYISEHGRPKVLHLSQFLKAVNKNGERDKPTVFQQEVDPPEGYEFYYGVSPFSQDSFSL